MWFGHWFPLLLKHKEVVLNKKKNQWKGFLQSMLYSSLLDISLFSK